MVRAAAGQLVASWAAPAGGYCQLLNITVSDCVEARRTRRRRLCAPQCCYWPVFRGRNNALDSALAHKDLGPLVSARSKCAPDRTCPHGMRWRGPRAQPRVKSRRQCPRQDSNLRSRLRRGLYYQDLTSGDVLADILPGRISGAVRWTAMDRLGSLP